MIFRWKSGVNTNEWLNIVNMTGSFYLNIYICMSILTNTHFSNLCCCCRMLARNKIAICELNNAALRMNWKKYKTGKKTTTTTHETLLSIDCARKFLGQPVYIQCWTDAVVRINMPYCRWMYAFVTDVSLLRPFQPSFIYLHSICFYISGFFWCILCQLH